MLEPVHLDTIFESALRLTGEPTAETLLQAIAKDERVVKALNDAIESDYPPEDSTGPTRAQFLRLTLLGLLNEKQTLGF